MNVGGRYAGGGLWAVAGVLIWTCVWCDCWLMCMQAPLTKPLISAIRAFGLRDVLRLVATPPIAVRQMRTSCEKSSR
jgi:hypothetical protein